MTTIFIPKREELLDYDYRINDLIISLGKLEGREPNQIRDDIMNIGYDVMKFRFIAPETEKGTFPLIDFEKSIENIKNMIKFGACSQIKEESQFRRPFNHATELVENCEIGQTERGSFVIMVRIPSKEKYLGDEEDQPEYLQELGQKTIIRLIDGIQEAEDLEIENEAEFKESYNKKLNKNVCGAISRLIEDQEGFNVKINARWDISNTPEDGVRNESEIKGDQHIQKFNRMKGYLEKIPETQTVTVRGLINIMKHEDINSPEEKRLIIINDSTLKKRIYVRLSSANYTSACNAHRDTKRVQVRGYLNKKQVHWVLDNPTNFRIILE